MRVFEHLDPKDVFFYFEEICRIPHGSGNITQISNYLANFAKEHHLQHVQDEAGNVIMIKEASEGYEDHEPVMLQGHMDMVAVKKPDADIDMVKEGLRIAVDGDKVYAEGTSLGGDDGIAVAYGLALMAGEYQHPRLELVITVEEETGMDGARVIDLSPCKAHTMINLDSEEEGIFLTGCAGGARVNYRHHMEATKQEGTYASLVVDGLMGGHSGAEIHKARGNANMILARALSKLNHAGVSFALISFDGGLADNAIPRQAKAEVLLLNGIEKAGSEIAQLQKDLKIEFEEKDPDVQIVLQLKNIEQKAAIEGNESEKLVQFLNNIPYGVLAMSSSLKGLVETSLNPGIIHIQNGELEIGISVRSSLEGSKEALIARLKDLGELAGMETEVMGEYPGWAFRTHSPLREKMIKVYQEMYKKEPKVEAIHAGLECGLLAGKIGDLDCVSIGPDMKNIHTTEEELSVSSTKRVWEFLLKLLSEM